MRIGSQGDIELAIQASKASTPSTKAENVKVETTQVVKEKVVNTQQVNTQIVQPVGEEQTGASLKGKLDEAVKSINEFLNTQHKASKFVFHEGLDKYYVQLVDAETEEVIKEIPPEKLLNAFYEMKKQAGMIVDEKI